MNQPQDDAAAAVAAQMAGQKAGNVASGTGQGTPVQSEASAAEVARLASEPIRPTGPAPQFSAQPVAPDNPVAVAAQMQPVASGYDMDALRAAIRAELEAERKAQEDAAAALIAQQPGFYPQPEGYSRPEDREVPALAGEHGWPTLPLTRDVPLPQGGTQPVTVHLPVTPQGDLVAIV